MKIVDQLSSVHREQGFDIHVLGNEEIQISVVPRLGAKIISLKNLRTGRQWMWHPPGGPKLFSNQAGDDFSRSPLVGADECLPTIAPCFWQGRRLPDHGEVWSEPWSVDSDAWIKGILKTSISLGISPFGMERTIALHDREVRISYCLHNLSSQPERFLWAFHPLLNLQPHDRLALPDSTRALLNGAAWVDDVPPAIPDQRSVKVFAKPVSEGLAGIRNLAHGDWLELAWNPAENNTLGVWLTRGGWHGHHQFALEPSNGDQDQLALAARHDCCGLVAAHGSVGWQICLRLGMDQQINPPTFPARSSDRGTTH